MVHLIRTYCVTPYKIQYKFQHDVISYAYAVLIFEKTNMSVSISPNVPILPNLSISPKFLVKKLSAISALPVINSYFRIIESFVKTSLENIKLWLCFWFVFELGILRNSHILSRSKTQRNLLTPQIVLLFLVKMTFNLMVMISLYVITNLFYIAS